MIIMSTYTYYMVDMNSMCNAVQWALLHLHHASSFSLDTCEKTPTTN